MDRRRFLRGLAAAASVGVAGCGGGDGDGGTPTGTPPGDDETPTPTRTPTLSPTEAPTPSQTESPTAAGTETPTDTPTVSPTPDPAAAVVTVGPDRSLSFDPDRVTVAVGETVRWEWEGRGHNVKPSSVPSGADWSGTPGDRSETYDAGYRYSHTFEVAGTYEYVCVPHESAGMTGTVVVEE